MKTLTFRSETKGYAFPEDLERMKGVLNERGYDASNEDLQRAWEAYSENYATGWMCLPKADEELFYALRLNLSEEE